MNKLICQKCRAHHGIPWRGDIDDWQWDRDRVLCPFEKDDDGQKLLYGRYVGEAPPPDCYYALEHVVGVVME